MRNRLLYLCRYLPWLALLLVVDAVSALLLWLSEAEAFGALIPLIMLGTVLLFSVTALVLSRVEQKRENAFRAFLNNPDLINEENLIRSVSASDRENVRLLGTVLREKDAVCSRAKASAEDYEEYVEAWAHETKNPLSLLTMVLDNQGDELPASAAFKLEYVRSRLQEHISQILYYARLKSGRKDYLFEPVDLNDCVSEVLEDYSLLLKEKNFRITVHVSEISVFSDRRGIEFLLGQIIRNAVKYSDCRKKQPELTISLEQLESEDVLRICDNGAGVKECDFPYIFEKGFTGNPADTGKKATGMGLYLCRKMADDLSLGLEARSQSGKGFEMSIRFPKVE